VISPGWLVGLRKARSKGLAGLVVRESGAISAVFLPHKKHEYYCQYIDRS
jgi:hypothetical protein